MKILKKYTVIFLYSMRFSMDKYFHKLVHNLIFSCTTGVKALEIYYCSRKIMKKTKRTRKAPIGNYKKIILKKIGCVLSSKADY